MKELGETIIEALMNAVVAQKDFDFTLRYDDNSFYPTAIRITNDGETWYIFKLTKEDLRFIVAETSPRVYRTSLRLRAEGIELFNKYVSKFYHKLEK